MAAEDDTFDIDLYGNEDEQQQEQEDDLYNQNIDKSADANGYDGANDQPQNAAAQENGGDEEIDFSEPANTEEQAPVPTVEQTPQPPQPPQRGTKRKAPDDEAEHNAGSQPPTANATNTAPQPIEPNATPALKLSELHWWTTEDDLRAFCARADTESSLHEVSFGEHKINGKAKGEAYLEFENPRAAHATKVEIERAAKTGEGVNKIPYQVWFCGVGNPFKNAKDSGGAVGAARKDYGAQASAGRGGGGAYNSYNNRGGFVRGGGFNGQNRGGGVVYNNTNNGYQNRMGNQQQQQQQGGWGMNNQYGNGGGNAAAGGYGMGGGFGNMQGMYNPAMMMGMMGRGIGGMGMNGMGGMGMNGMGGMGMGGMGGLRGGGNMMGRGGWNAGGGGGGMNQGGYGNGQGFGQAQGQQNKKPRME